MGAGVWIDCDGISVRAQGTVADLGASGSLAACARFVASTPATTTTLVPPTAEVTAGPTAQQPDGSPLVCDFATG
jgi:hypothetical protein